MGTELLGGSYLALPDGAAPFPGVVVVHEASGLNDNVIGPATEGRTGENGAVAGGERQERR